MVFARERALAAGNVSTAGAITKMGLQIGTEADYLRAHLTVIVAGSRSRNSALRNLKQRVTSILKKWLAAVPKERGPV
jgi:hypothetical protein